MSAPVTPKSFEELAVRSGLIQPDTMHDLKVRFPAKTDSAQGFADLLVEEQLLTSWHVDKLLSGRHRGFFLGPYRLQAHLARGGMSTLYVAQHQETGNKRALKVLSPIKAGQASYLPRFIREAKLASQLRHENIIRVFDLLNVSDGVSDIHFMVMELLNGSDLFHKVSLEGPLSVRQAVELIFQAAVGLGYSHRRGLVHRDIKPGNLFLTRQGTLKVLDLGLATIAENQDESLTRVCNERVLGTADYLAPEQAIDSHRADSRADIYALGCTFYFLLAGHPPFHEGSLAQRILAHQSKEPRDIRELRSDVPEELAAILSSMMVKRRARRIQTCEDVAEKLQSWLKSRSGEQKYDHVAVVIKSEDDEPLVGRKLRRVRPVKRTVQAETPTDSIRASETQSGPGNDLEVRLEDPDAVVSEYSEQFEVFLEGLDDENGLLTVMFPESRRQTCREFSQSLNEDLVSSASGPPDDADEAKASVSTALQVPADRPRFSAWGRGLLAAVAVLSTAIMISQTDVVWLRQLGYLLLNCW